MTPDDEVRVVLVDDQELVRSGLRRILRRRDGFAIVAECADGSELPGALAAHEADVVVMDLRMKDVDGIEATRRLRAATRRPACARPFRSAQGLQGRVGWSSPAPCRTGKDETRR